MITMIIIMNTLMRRKTTTRKEQERDVKEKYQEQVREDEKIAASISMRRITITTAATKLTKYNNYSNTLTSTIQEHSTSP